MMRRLIITVGFLVCSCATLAAVPSVRVSEPRDFGYFIGDELTRTAWISVDADARIEPATLPKPGSLSYWLKLKRVNVDEARDGARRIYRIRLQYQTFYAPLEPKKLEIPAVRLRILGADGAREEASVPAFAFLSSPLREIMPAKEAAESNEDRLRPDVAPRLISTAAERTVMAVSSTAGLGVLALLAHHFAIWPFHRRRARPFTRAMRVVAREAAKGDAAGDFRGALLSVHRAFDESARRRVLAADLDGFLKELPQFQGLESDIQRFFVQSRAVFFGTGVANGPRDMPLEDLAQFAAAMSERERAA